MSLATPERLTWLNSRFRSEIRTRVRSVSFSIPVFVR